MSVQQNFIAGSWVNRGSESENINPSDISDIIGVYNRANSELTKQAIAAAREAFKTWPHSTPPCTIH